MIEVICDRCKKNCGLNAYDVSIGVIHNPCPHHSYDLGDLRITDDNTHMRLILCQDCFDALGFPNIYVVHRTHKIKFDKIKEE